MTKEEAERIIRAARKRRAPLPRDWHFADGLVERNFSIQDVHNILDHGHIARIDESDDEDDDGPICHTVRVEGSALDGRPAAIAILINRVETSILLTVIDLSH